MINPKHPQRPEPERYPGPARHWGLSHRPTSARLIPKWLTLGGSNLATDHRVRDTQRVSVGGDSTTRSGYSFTEAQMPRAASGPNFPDYHVRTDAHCLRAVGDQTAADPKRREAQRITVCGPNFTPGQLVNDSHKPAAGGEA